MAIYLYKKTHNKTGLQYLGKTKRDPFNYRGSGKYWQNHINKHGNDVTTEILKECSCNEEIKEWGIYYSKLWNVVESTEWANLKEERGDGGGQLMIDPQIKEKHRNACIDAGKDPALREKRKIRQTIRANSPQHRERMKFNNPSKMMNNRIKLSNARHRDWNREEYRNKMSGESHYKYDSSEYHFINKSGDIEKCTSRALAEKYSIHHSNVRHVILGRRKSCGGWTLFNE